MNNQLVSCVTWWRRFMVQYRPRSVPLALADMKRVVSYSDGEGDGAGVGVCVWATGMAKPLAKYLAIPPELRRVWNTKMGTDEIGNDIYLIEAVGPLVLLCTFPKVMNNSLWLHFIDNTSAQYSLVRGSSSVYSGDHIIGLTWEMSAQLGTYPYYDRVHTKSNPIDGVSRGDFTGPWGRVYAAKLPVETILERFREVT